MVKLFPTTITTHIYNVMARWNHGAVSNELYLMVNLEKETQKNKTL